MKTLYIIRNAKNHDEYFSFTNKREAEKELNHMNKGEAKVCTPHGIDKPYEIIELINIYMVLDTAGPDDFLIQEFETLKEARDYAKKHFLTLGKKCIRKEDSLHTACGKAYEEIETYENI